MKFRKVILLWKTYSTAITYLASIEKLSITGAQ